MEDVHSRRGRGDVARRASSEVTSSPAPEGSERPLPRVAYRAYYGKPMAPKRERGPVPGSGATHPSAAAMPPAGELQYRNGGLSRGHDVIVTSYGQRKLAGFYREG